MPLPTRLSPTIILTIESKSYKRPFERITLLCLRSISCGISSKLAYNFSSQLVEVIYILSAVWEKYEITYTCVSFSCKFYSFPTLFRHLRVIFCSQRFNVCFSFFIKLNFQFFCLPEIMYTFRRECIGFDSNILRVIAFLLFIYLRIYFVAWHLFFLFKISMLWNCKVL